MVHLQVAEKVSSRVARIGIYFKAGSRYEPAAHPGISHYLRAATGLTTQNSSIFAITRNIELAGASFNVHGDRENIVYKVHCLRDNLSDVLPFVCDAITRNEFRSWELADIVEKRLEYDLEAYKKNQMAMLIEALHKAAYRGGLAHSLYCPQHQIKKIKRDHLIQYVKDNLVASRLKVVAMGVDQLDLQRELEQNIEMSTHYNGVDGSSRYVGGEARVQGPFSNTMVAVVGPTPGETNEKTATALRVYESLLGSYGSPIKYSTGTESSLQTATQKSAGSKVIAKTLNISHSDTGLFGITVQAENRDIGTAVKRALAHLKSTAKNVNAEQLAKAKYAAKARAYLQSEDQESVFESIVSGPSSNVGEKIDEISASDVASAVTSVCSKLSIATIGNPRYVPYLDELEA